MRHTEAEDHLTGRGKQERKMKEWRKRESCLPFRENVDFHKMSSWERHFGFGSKEIFVDIFNHSVIWYFVQMALMKYSK